MTAIDKTLAALAAATCMVCAAEAADSASGSLPADVTRGKYLVQIAGCNDYHTAGYAETGGKVEESKWLLGVPAPPK